MRIDKLKNHFGMARHSIYLTFYNSLMYVGVIYLLHEAPPSAENALGGAMCLDVGTVLRQVG